MVSVRLLILAAATRLKEPYTRRWGPMRSDQATVRWQGCSTAGWVRGDLQVDSIVRDPVYLTGPYMTNVAFKKISDKQGWDPTPCRANEAR